MPQLNDGRRPPRSPPRRRRQRDTAAGRTTRRGTNAQALPRACFHSSASVPTRVGVVADDVVDLERVDAGLQLDVVADLVDRHVAGELAVGAGPLEDLEAVDEQEHGVVAR